MNKIITIVAGIVCIIGIFSGIHTASAEDIGTLRLEFASTEQTFDAKPQTLYVKIVELENGTEKLFRELEIEGQKNVGFTVPTGKYKVYVQAQGHRTIWELDDEGEGYEVTSSETTVVPASENTYCKDVFADGPWRAQTEEIPVLVMVKDANGCGDYDLGNVEIYLDQDCDMSNNELGDTLLETVTDWYGITVDDTFYNLYHPGDWYDITYLSASEHNLKENVCFHVVIRDIGGILDPDGDAHSHFNVTVSNNDLPSSANWYAGDTHYHSSYTDNVVEFGYPVEATKEAGKSIGLEWNMITDHSFDIKDSKTSDPNHKWNALKNDVNSYSGLYKLILGEEVSCLNSNGNVIHFLVFGMENFSNVGNTGLDYIPGDIDEFGTTGWSLQDVIENVTEQGGIGYGAHPTADDPLRDHWHNGDYDLSGYNGLEIWNGVSNEDNEWFINLKEGLKEWRRLLLNGREDVFIAGGSDAHGDFSHGFGKVRTYVYTENFSKDEVLNALKNGRSIMTDGPFLTFNITNEDGRTAIIGDNISGNEFKMNVMWNSTPESGEVDHISFHMGVVGEEEEEIIEYQLTPDSLSGVKQYTDLTNKIPKIKKAYVRLNATTDKGKMVYTNPIWVSKTVQPTIYVPDDYSTIQEAIYNSKTGDIIAVRDGTYYENIVVNKSLTIMSENGSANCIIDASGSGSAMTLKENRSWIVGFTLTNFTLTNFTYTDDLYYCAGIKITSNFNTLIYNNISYNDRGIYLLSSNNNTISNNNLFNNYVSIDSSDSSNNTISNNNLFNNYQGVQMGDSSNNIIKKNTISSSGRNGIDFFHFSTDNTIINNNIISNNESGIIFDLSNNNTVTGNTISSNRRYGMDVLHSNNNTIWGNNVSSNNWGGIDLFNSNKSIIINNNISLNEMGIHLSRSNNCSLINNHVSNNYYCGIRFYKSNNNSIVCSSFLSNKNLGIYLEISRDNTVTDNIISNSFNSLILSSSSKNTITSNNVSNNNYGMLLIQSNENTIFNNNISNNERYGIYQSLSRNNIIVNNVILNNTKYGIECRDSSNIAICNNIMSKNGLYINGHSLHYWNTHIIENNTVNGKPLYYYKNQTGGKVPDAGQVILGNCTGMTVENVNLSNANVGVELGFSYQNVIKNNTIASNNDIGIYLYSSSNNNVTSNNISNNVGGIDLSYSSNNTIYLNNFINNTNNVYSSSSTNIWNSTSEMTYNYNSSTFTNYLGNYWDDYSGLDNNSDGIGDTSYLIETGADNYPLMQLFENYIPNTPTGENVTVDSGSTLIIFSNVTEAGATTIDSQKNNPEGPSSNFNLSNYFVNISTTSEFTPPVIVCINYTGKVTDESGLNLLHWNGSWENITTSVDTQSNTICGEVSHLSWFGLGYSKQNQAPVARLTYSPQNPMVNESVEFNASGSHDSDGNITSYEWDFGDGNSTNTNQTVIGYTYITPGCYQVNLTVTDNNGLTNSTSTPIAVGCGDVNYDSTMDISDVILLLYNVGYPGQYELCSEWAGDVTGDGTTDISDVIRLLYYVGYPGQYELECKC